MASTGKLPSPQQLATNAISTAHMYINSRFGDRAPVHKAEECTGVIRVGGYINSRGKKVAPYERTCPYHSNGARRGGGASGGAGASGGFALTEGFSSDRTNNPGDVMRLKRNLAKMNYYHPDKRSESTNDFHGYPNDALVNAIKRFQQDNGLPVTGTMARGGPTEAALNSKYEFRGARFEHPVNADKKQIAVFDGKSLTLYDGDKPVKSWSGNAGKLDFQSPEFQDVVGKGPLPVGMYVARQSEFYYFDDMTWVERRLAPLGLWTRFPGGRASWGSAKVSLEPSLQNDMRGRSGFTVHGGTTPGSKGCIDLEDNIDDFAEWFDKNGKDVVIQVKYD